MDQHSDGITEEFTAIVQLSVAQASLVVEEIMRRLERRARVLEAEASVRRAEFQRRHDAEIAAMRAQVQPVMREDWWRRASPERIGATYELAAGFEPFDRVAAAAAERMREEVQQRWGVDIAAVARDARRAETLRASAAGKAVDEMTPDERHVSYLDAQRFLAEADPELHEQLGQRLVEASAEEERLTAAQTAAAEGLPRLQAEQYAAQTEAIEARRRILYEQHVAQQAQQNAETEQGQNQDQDSDRPVQVDVPLAEAKLAAAEAADRAAADRAAGDFERVDQLFEQADTDRDQRIGNDISTDAATGAATSSRPRDEEAVTYDEAMAWLSEQAPMAAEALKVDVENAAVTGGQRYAEENVIRTYRHLKQADTAAGVQDGPVAYDTRERRTGTEHSLRAAGAEPEAVEARMLDDVSNALPPSAAARRGRQPAARKGRAAQDMGRELGDHGR
ncbi:hypothetical protein [Kribbella sp. NPDC048928]|uniref:hypothetical protein n=1 Tax=Kribbella sp. NPDC048928 TaxID=3364111 RepID=UPI003718C6BC